jgi:predicted nucleic acid-binding protein
MAAEADFLITGDRDFSEVQTLGNTTIISVSSFKQLVCDD